MSVLLKLIHRLNTILIKNPAGFLVDMDKPHSKMYMKKDRNKKSQKFLRNNGRLEGLKVLHLKT